MKNYLVIVFIFFQCGTAQKEKEPVEAEKTGFSYIDYHFDRVWEIVYSLRVDSAGDMFLLGTKYDKLGYFQGKLPHKDVIHLDSLLQKAVVANLKSEYRQEGLADGLSYSLNFIYKNKKYSYNLYGNNVPEPLTQVRLFLDKKVLKSKFSPDKHVAAFRELRRYFYKTYDYIDSLPSWESDYPKIDLEPWSISNIGDK